MTDQIRNLLTAILFLLVTISFNSEAQKKNDCGISCYSTSIVAVEKSGECYRYTILVRYDGSCPFELSHYGFGLGCGTFSDVSNSEGWKMELNQTDPTTGLTGFKVDDIQGFGKNPGFSSFEVVFTFCADNDCADAVECIVPQVAYKAGQCVYYEEVEVDCAGPQQLTVLAQKQDPLCSGAADGTISLEIAGGLPPYRVAWNTGDTGPALQGLFAGLYSYTVSDQDGRTQTGEVEITEPDALVIGGVVTHPVCGDAVPAGSIDVTVQGGTAPYSYAWDNGDTGEDLMAVEEGTYNVEVTDKYACREEKTFVLTTITDIQLTADVVHPNCDGTRPGSIDLHIAGGTEPYTVVWSWNETTQTGTAISGLEAGYYRATVTDANGCQVVRTYALRTEIDIELSLNKVDIPCTGTTGGPSTWRLSAAKAPT